MNIEHLSRRNPDLVHAITELVADHRRRRTNIYRHELMAYAHELGARRWAINPDTVTRTVQELFAAGILYGTGKTGTAIRLTGFGEAWRHHRIDTIPILDQYTDPDTGTDVPNVRRWRQG